MAKIITLRDWGRVGNDTEAFDKRFNLEIDGIPYDSKFLYTEFGYNLKMNEVSAAFGLEQLKKLPKFIKQREENFNALKIFFLGYEKWLHIPYLPESATTNWLAFPLCIKRGTPFTRYEFLQHLETDGIQTRVLFSGNITRHPVYKKNGPWRAASSLDNADHVMANGFLLGCHHGMGAKEVDYIAQSASNFFKKYEKVLSNNIPATKKIKTKRRHAHMESLSLN